MKVLSRSLLAGLVLSLSGSTQVFAADAHASTLGGQKLPFYVYETFKSPKNHFIPSGWMGDTGDIQFNDNYKAPNSTTAAIKVGYSGQARQGNGWAGIYWQSPANNWGSKSGGFNLNGAKKVVFKARGEKGGEVINEFKIGGINGDYGDSGNAALGPVTLTKDWKEYTISLEGQELSNIIGGFCWATNKDANPTGATFYLSDIRYE